MLANADYYQHHLDRVSRSFAFCIARLDMPLREYVGLAYLLCRLLDTVEDSAWTDGDLQAQAFSIFDRLLQEDSTAKVSDLSALFRAPLASGETLLVQDAERLFADFRALPPAVKEALRGPILSMSSGMHYFSQRKTRGELRLKNLLEVNQYCFFVAGVVGEILNRLIQLNNVDSLENAFHFGLFLQKINLLKDQATDEVQGHYFVPSRSVVNSSLRTHALKAFDYMTMLPLKMKPYRLFCGWALFLGLASLPWIDRAWSEKKRLKIPRLQTALLLSEIEDAVGDNDALKNLFHSYMQKAKLGEAVKESSSDESAELDWSRLYKGTLSFRQVQALGCA